MEGALILPSEEDNNTFSINFSSGEVYKGWRSKEEKLLAQKQHQKVKEKKNGKKWEKLMTDRSVYNNFITRGLIG